ncbi:hypothetical protein E5Q_03474 [Mixia osmundae IAM 14324]|uniref:AMMECR1 domain-containing protein n=1 Tax=Mixia osmundae (strain CBS 9802 / IAM 14324 / JCM 22182 / KY 12970) TaxID=764103 RepID=G7E1U2_MIXOS|nr:hypothetical protein E5Q_03474 [Mixia osmundae IAM 14324]
MAGSSAASLSSADSDEAAKQIHALYCFDVLSARLSGSPIPSPSFDDRLQAYPLFVTWNIQSSSSSKRSPRLRGCIGNFTAAPLGTGLREYAEISAFKDSRFNPINSAELPRLQCSVSLLTHFEEADDYLDWQIGQHGIYIHLPDPHDHTRSIAQSLSRRSARELSATYLPDVMPEQGWSKPEAVKSAVRKSGYSGRITQEILNSIRLTRYQSSKVTVTYDEWRAASAASSLASSPSPVSS